MGGSRLFPAVCSIFLAIIPVAASVTVWYQPQVTFVPSSTRTLPNGTFEGYQAYNPAVLQPPAPPAPSSFATQVTLQLTDAPMPNASLPQPGSFMGFSVEMSVANQVFGTNGSFLSVPFLNLMSNLAQRSGRINIRVGGNTQETATLVESTSDGKIIEKDLANTSNPTQTPPLVFTAELLYMLHNISEHVNIRWHLGVPFNDTSNFRLEIIEQGQAILGDYLIGLQAGNEPDLYVKHGHRPDSYGPQDYTNEIGQLIQAMKADSLIGQRPLSLLVGPSVQVNWTLDQVFATGFIDDYHDNLAFLSVERYPNDNCAVAFPGSGGTIHDPQETFPSYLTHANARDTLSVYASALGTAQQKNKPLLMFETNSASCGGFIGISDSFGAALWGVDYTMKMAAMNFSGAMFHVGGQSVSYNPFTPPPTDESLIHQWTVGPIYYSSLVVAEALGPTNTSQVVDLTDTFSLNDLSPAYAIWENNHLSRVLIINFITDPAAANNVNVTLNIDQSLFNSGTIQVKYLQAPSVSQKGNITWANQTFGDNFASDGRPVGDEQVLTIPCTSPTSCTIPVPAPAAALIFLPSPPESSDTHLGEEAATRGAPIQTFPTTAITRTKNTATIPPSSLATFTFASSDLIPLGKIGLQAGEFGSTSPEALKNEAVGMSGGLLLLHVTVLMSIVMTQIGWMLLL